MENKKRKGEGEDIRYPEEVRRDFVERMQRLVETSKRLKKGKGVDDIKGGEGK